MKITLNDMMIILSRLPEDVKKQTVLSITGATDGKPPKPCYQIHLRDEEGKEHYILVPQDKKDVMYDSYGVRKIPHELKHEYDISRNQIRCNISENDVVISVCILSVDPGSGTWNVTFWNTRDGYKHKGYGKESMKLVLYKAVEIYGFPEIMQYTWNGDNQYVLEWMEKHFDAECICPLAVQKTQPDDDRESHIYVLDRKKVSAYFSLDKAPAACADMSYDGSCRRCITSGMCQTLHGHCGYYRSRG